MIADSIHRSPVTARWMVLTLAVAAAPAAGLDGIDRATHHDAVGFYVVLPSVVVVGETARARVVSLDAPWQRFPSWRGKIPFHGAARITCTDRAASVPSEVAVPPEAGGRFQFEVVFHTPGVHRLAVADRRRPSVAGRSNPVWVVDGAGTDPPRIFWGDLHGHTCFSDGSSDPPHFLSHAKDVSLLDFVAITDHADSNGYRGCLDDEEWAAIQDYARSWTEPDRFLVFTGFEWTSNEYGHRHVVYREEGGDYYSSVDPAYDEPGELYAALSALDPEGVVVIPHHPNHGHRLAFHDPVLEPVVEVCSGHGVSVTCPHPLWTGPCGDWTPEWASWLDMLQVGRRVGAVGSGDSHDGAPGRIGGGDVGSEVCHGDPGRVPRLRNKRGLVGVQAPELTPAAVFAGIRSRATVATTGPRFLLDLRVAGGSIGSEVVTDEVWPSVVVRAAGEGPVRVEVVRDGAVLRIFEAEGTEVNESFLDTGFDPPDGGASYYFLRVIQPEDQEWGWTSPVWVSRPARRADGSAAR